MKKVFKWLDFLRECEPKTIYKICVGIVIFFSTVYSVQAWVVNINKAIAEGKCAIEKSEKREEKIEKLNTRVCVLEETYKSIDGKLNILIARGRND